MNTRIWLPLCASFMLVAADSDVQPVGPLPPRPAPIAIEAATQPKRSQDPTHIGDDLLNLQEAVARVTELLSAGSTTTTGTTATNTPIIGSDGVTADQMTIRRSQQFDISVSRAPNGETTVSATITRERLEPVYRELGQLLERPIDDAGLTITQRLVTLTVRDVPWDECLDRLFGQAGLYWTESGSGNTAKIIVAEKPIITGDEQRESVSERARRALLRAASGETNATAAEALYLLAYQEAESGHYLDAIRSYSRLVSDFDDHKNPSVTVWVQRAVRGIADAMAAAGQPQEALGVYRSYIARADPLSADVPHVYLSAAKAALDLAKRSNDNSARDDATLFLGALVERFGDHSEATAVVAESRLILAELLINSQRWDEAEQHLANHVRTTRREDERIAYWRAECQFHLGRYDDALKRYERIAAPDCTLGDAERSRAAVRIGECMLARRTPQYARALFAFLRARQAWPRLRMDGEVMVAIARCYAELEFEEAAIAEFWTLLRGDSLGDQAARDQLGQFLGGLQSSLGNYDTAVRARVLFYIAEADHRQAWRDRSRRSQLVADSIQRYDRALKENPPASMRNACRLGMARVAFLGSEDVLGRQVLAELLADAEASDRDRQMAAQILGDHHRDQGRLREAIAAYQGGKP